MTLRRAFLMILLGSPASAMACSCASTLSPEAAYAGAEHVAIVRVLSTHTDSERVTVLVIDAASQDQKPRTETSTNRYLVGTGRIVSTLKGAPMRTVAIRALHRGSSCHAPLQVGSEYVLFWDGDKAYHSYCQRQPLLTDVPPGLLERWGYPPR